MSHSNVKSDHPFLNSIIGVEVKNPDATEFNESHYGGLPWADGFKYQILTPAKIVDCGMIGHRKPTATRKGVSA